jgi:sarcosine oxidase subunit beta
MSDGEMQTDALPRTAAVVVIGGGVNGASTAFQLTRRGVRDVVLLGRRRLGAGASGKSGALIRCHYANPHEARLTHESLHVFRHWDEEVGYGSPGFEPVGFVQVVHPDDEEHLRANVAAHRAIGIESFVVSAEELREIEPLLRTDDLTYGAFEPGSGFADPNATLYGFAAAPGRIGCCGRWG